MMEISILKLIIKLYIHNPLVQDFIVESIVKAYILLTNLFNKNDLPLLEGPQIVIIVNYFYFYKFCNIFFA